MNDENHGLEADHSQAILEQRAQYYSQSKIQTKTEQLSVISFSRAHHNYALPLPTFKEICPLESYRAIPKASSIVPGLIAYRGEILGTHDLGPFLLDKATTLKPEWALIIEAESQLYALLADEVFGVEDYSPSAIQPTPLTLNQWGPVFKGLIAGRLLLIDSSELFRNPRFCLSF